MDVFDNLTNSNSLQGLAGVRSNKPWLSSEILLITPVQTLHVTSRQDRRDLVRLYLLNSYPVPRFLVLRAVSFQTLRVYGIISDTQS